jgi:hypothetical protein
LEFEKLPEFISSIRKIEKTSPTSFSCLWAKKDAQLTTNVEIIMRVPERRIAWQAVSEDFRVGVVFLDSLVGGITKVTIKVRSIVEPVMLTTRSVSIFATSNDSPNAARDEHARRRSRYFIRRSPRMAVMQLVETHEAADGAIMKSSRKLFGASPLKSAASEISHSARGPKQHLGQHPRID